MVTPNSEAGDSSELDLGTLHIVVGVLVVIAFLLTGQYMDRAHDHLMGMDDTKRMLYRSTHLYILYAGLLNGAVGIGWQSYGVQSARLIRYAASLLLMAVPVLLLMGFFIEPNLTALARPYTRPATYAVLGGGSGLLIAYVLERGLHLKNESR